VRVRVRAMRGDECECARSMGGRSRRRGRWMMTTPMGDDATRAMRDGRRVSVVWKYSRACARACASFTDASSTTDRARIIARGTRSRIFTRDRERRAVTTDASTRRRGGSANGKARGRTRSNSVVDSTNARSTGRLTKARVLPFPRARRIHRLARPGGDGCDV